MDAISSRGFVELITRSDSFPGSRVPRASSHSRHSVEFSQHQVDMAVNEARKNRSTLSVDHPNSRFGCWHGRLFPAASTLSPLIKTAPFSIGGAPVPSIKISFRMMTRFILSSYCHFYSSNNYYLNSLLPKRSRTFSVIARKKRIYCYCSTVVVRAFCAAHKRLE